MDEQTKVIKDWLGTGSINVFGLPFAGKDTQGEILAEKFGGILISSGDILRHNKDHPRLKKILASGELVPPDVFEEVVIPYLAKSELKGRPLILSEVGRMKGEHLAVIKATDVSNHPQKAVILLKLPDEEVFNRFEAAKQIHDRGDRGDDHREVLQNRLDNYHEKVTPVLDYYRNENLLIEVDGTQTREEVSAEILSQLFKRTSSD